MSQMYRICACHSTSSERWRQPAGREDRTHDLRVSARDANYCATPPLTSDEIIYFSDSSELGFGAVLGKEYILTSHLSRNIGAYWI